MASMSVLERAISTSLRRLSLVPTPLRALLRRKTSCCKGPRRMDKRVNLKLWEVSDATWSSRERLCRWK